MSSAARLLANLLILLSLAMYGCAGDDTGSGDGTDGNGANDGSGSGMDGDNGSGSSSDGDGSGSDSDGSGSDGSGGQDGLPQFTPMFAGAPSGDAGQPLMQGELCDYVPNDGETLMDGPLTTCFFDENGDMTMPAATFEQVLECVDGVDTVHIRLTFDPYFVDNTYGDGSIGWGNRGHTMDRDLVKSDHAEILMTNGDGEVVVQFKLDYIEADPSADSGWASAGVTGGDGEMIVGDPEDIIDFSTSLDRNLNERGYGDYDVDSPATDDDYTANDDTPDWDYRMVYEAWIDVDAFGDSGFADAFIEYVHASPSKDTTDTLMVTPGPCPPDWTPGCTDPNGCEDFPGDAPDCPLDDPDGYLNICCVDADGYFAACTDTPGTTSGDPCTDGDPDTFCDEGGQVPGSGDPIDCMANPSLPECIVD